jgi:hypothetical protein
VLFFMSSFLARFNNLTMSIEGVIFRTVKENRLRMFISPDTYLGNFGIHISADKRVVLC